MMLLKNLRSPKLLTGMFRPKHFFSGIVYLDYQATTPIDYRVYDAMTPYMLHNYGNPHSKTHQFGWDGSKGV